MDAAGRWSRTLSAGDPRGTGRDAAGRSQEEEAIEHIVRTLLRRWGVVFWRLLAREADWLPPWRDLLMCCRRLEARGEIRGGRFVAGFTGEQYAAPEAIALLREARPQTARGSLPVTLGSGSFEPGRDPHTRCTLATLSQAATCRSTATARAGGAFLEGEVSFLETLAPQEQWQAKNLLLRRHVPAALADLAWSVPARRARRCSGGTPGARVRLFFVPVLPLLHGGHRVPDVLVRIHCRVGITNDLASGGDDIGVCDSRAVDDPRVRRHKPS